MKSGNGGVGHRKLGGIGGDGGSILLKANANSTLKSVYASNTRKRYIANSGENSRRTKLFGENAKDLVIDVPLGITAMTDTGLVIGEVNGENEELLIAKGGKGGKSGNKFIAGEGTAFSINLDLKLIADVGLIGFPNAGKSTFLSLVSRAQPKIANYPFTTLTPQIGFIEFEDKRSVSVADLPGLVEGAHMNRGMGHKFLKHISRTMINLFIVDVNGFQLNHKFSKRSVFETVVFLNKELELYEPSLLEKPSILVINKMDTENAEEEFQEFLTLYNDYENSIKNVEEDWVPENKVNFNKIFNISAKSNQNVEELCFELREVIDILDDKKRASTLQKTDHQKKSNQNNLLSELV